MMTDNDERRVGTNYFVQASQGRSVYDKWLQLMRELPGELIDADTYVVRVIDLKKDDTPVKWKHMTVSNPDE
jgi:hypothetical protein